MQDGGNEQPRTGVTSSLEDVRARSAEKLNKKGSEEAENPVAGTKTPATGGPEDSAAGAEDDLELSEPGPAETEIEAVEDELELSDADTVQTGEAEQTDADETTMSDNMRPVETEIRMADGANYVGTIYIQKDSRVLDFLNEPAPFFALTEQNGKVRLLSKSQVLQIVPYDRGDTSAAASRGGGALM